MKRHNFTNISDNELETGHHHLQILGPLLYARVLKTSELQQNSGYKHGIKSFHKCIAKLKNQNFIGTISENKFSEQFIYPKKKIISHYKGEKWQNYSLPDQNLDTIRLYWQIKKLFEYMRETKKCSESQSYINNDGPYFDFRVVLNLKQNSRFGLYAHQSFGDDEAIYFKSFKQRFSKAFLEIPILVTNDWNIELFRELTKHYFENTDVMNKLAWCHMDASRMTIKSILSAPLITTELTTTLGEYISGQNKEVAREAEVNNPAPEEEVSLWQNIKEAFH